MIRYRLFAAIALTSLVSACASKEDRAIRSDPDFEAGYSAGCAAASTESANYREGPKRDDELYKNDEAYRRGWGNGYSTCKRSLTPPNRSGGSIIHDPSPGN
jgi:hypothetical protein